MIRHSCRTEERERSYVRQGLSFYDGAGARNRICTAKDKRFTEEANPAFLFIRKPPLAAGIYYVNL